MDQSSVEMTNLTRVESTSGKPFDTDPERGSTQQRHGTLLISEKADDISSTSESLSTPGGVATWKTTFLRFGPLAGIFAMCCALASIFASLGILVGSDEAAVKSWKIQPPAYLAIFIAVANQSMRFAAWQGLAIAWWTRASQDKSTVARLHWDWRAGTTIRGAVMAGRYFSWLGIACICSTLVAIDGPLLQRATKVKPAPILGETVDLQYSITETIPRAFTGAWYRSPGGFSGFWKDNLIPTSDGNVTENIVCLSAGNFDVGARVPWQKNQPIQHLTKGCSGTCRAKVTAPALAVTSCRSEVVPVNYSTAAPQIEHHPGNYPLDRIALVVFPYLLKNGDNEEINLVTGFSQTQDCAGSFNYTACTLQSAVGEYDVVISDNTLHNIPGNPKILSIANNDPVDRRPQPPGSGEPSTLGGLVSGIFYQWGGILGMFADGPGTPIVTGIGSVTQDMFLEPDSVTPNQCPSFTDPQPLILSEMNKLAFYTGVFAAAPNPDDIPYLTLSGLGHSRNVTADIIGPHNVFETNYHWFIAATVVELICIALILPSYYGWWNLGRAVSLSPLEIAKAFDAPALRSCNSNSSGGEIARDMKDIGLKYGATNGLSISGTRITFANPAAAEVPQRNASLQN